MGREYLFEQYYQQANQYDKGGNSHHDHADLHSDAHIDNASRDQHSDNHQDRCNC